MKVSELTGAELDWYVAKAEGIENIELRTAQRATNRICVVKASGGRQFDYTYSPSTQWSVGGPLLEKVKVQLTPHQEFYNGDCWSADVWGGKAHVGYVSTTFSGPTALIAAMRAYVASVFGPEVEDI